MLKSSASAECHVPAQGACLRVCDMAVTECFNFDAHICLDTSIDFVVVLFAWVSSSCFAVVLFCFCCCLLLLFVFGGCRQKQKTILGGRGGSGPHSMRGLWPGILCMRCFGLLHCLSQGTLLALKQIVFSHAV